MYHIFVQVFVSAGVAARPAGGGGSTSPRALHRPRAGTSTVTVRITHTTVSILYYTNKGTSCLSYLLYLSVLPVLKENDFPRIYYNI